MNKTLSYILVGGASALAGVVAGYILCKKRLEIKFQEELSEAVNKELEGIRASKKEEHPDKPHVVVNPLDYVQESDIYQMIYDEFAEEAEKAGKPLNSYHVSLLAQCLMTCRENRFTEEETKIAIEKLMAEMGSPDDDEEDDIDEDGAEEPQLVMEEYQNNPPEVIPLEEYSCLPSYLTTLTFHYFEEDDVLIDDGDMVVDDIDDVVGDALVHFGDGSDDDDTVYVVNGRLGLAIEIVRLHSSYSGWNGWGGGNE